MVVVEGVGWAVAEAVVGGGEGRLLLAARWRRFFAMHIERVYTPLKTRLARVFHEGSI